MKTVLSLFLLATSLAAQQSTILEVTTKDGRTERVQPLELRGDTARFKVQILGGEMTVSRKLAEFQPASAYQFEVAVTQPKTFAEHFALAKKAADLDLLPQAGAAARRAIEALGDAADLDAKTSEVRGWAADTLEAKLIAAVTAKHVESAKHILKLLTTRLADMRSEEQLDALAESVDTLVQTAAEAQQAARQAKLEAKAHEEAFRKLKPIHDRIAQGDKLQKSGIAKSRSTVQSARLCEQSIDSYKAAWKAAEALAAKHPDDAALGEELAAIGARLHDSAIRSALHAANMLTVQSDYKGAMDWANKVLQFDPENAEAKEMVRTIQLSQAAAGSNWGWGWRAVGGGGVDPRRN